MALIVCPHCGRTVSDSVERCIHCGNLTHTGQAYTQAAYPPQFTYSPPAGQYAPPQYASSQYAAPQYATPQYAPPQAANGGNYTVCQECGSVYKENVEVCSVCGSRIKPAFGVKNEYSSANYQKADCAQAEQEKVARLWKKKVEVVKQVSKVIIWLEVVICIIIAICIYAFVKKFLSWPVLDWTSSLTDIENALKTIENFRPDTESLARCISYFIFTVCFVGALRTELFRWECVPWLKKNKINLIPLVKRTNSIANSSSQITIEDEEFVCDPESFRMLSTAAYLATVPKSKTLPILRLILNIVFAITFATFLCLAFYELIDAFCISQGVVDNIEDLFMNSEEIVQTDEFDFQDKVIAVGLFLNMLLYLIFILIINSVFNKRKDKWVKSLTAKKSSVKHY